jgi:hypothetical protein
MLQNTADWIREECQHYGLPIVKLSASQAQGSGRGVAGHVDLGAAGGGHHDPGPNFPWAEVMDLARRGSPPPRPTAAAYVPLEGGTVGVNPDGRLEVFGVKTSAVQHRWQSKPGGAWAPGWQSLGEPGG